MKQLSSRIDEVFEMSGVLKNPESLSAAIVVPTGKITVFENVVDVEVWKDNRILNVKVNTQGTYPPVVADGKLCEEYALNICTIAETEKDSGVYYIKSLGFSEDENGTYTGINKDKPELLDETEITSENLFFIKTGVKPVTPFRRVDRYYQAAANKLFVPTKSYFLGDFSFGKYHFDITNWAGTRVHFNAGKTAFAQEFSKVLVKYNFADKESEWVLFDSAALPLMSYDLDFNNLSYIVSNNTTNGPQDESCMAGEDLVFLFGEVDVPAGIDVNLVLDKETEVNVDAALYETLRFRVKVLGEVSDENAILTYTRADGAVGEQPFKLASAAIDVEGYHVFELRLREVQVWQNTVSKIKITLPEGNYELDYVKLFPTGNASDVKLGKALPMFSDGHFEKGFFVGGMEHGLTATDDYFATAPGADKAREEYENAVRDDASKPDKMYPDWRMVPLYAYDYINSYKNLEGTFIGDLLGAGGLLEFGDWYFDEFCATWLIGAVLIALVNKMPEKEFVSTYISGAADLMGVILVLCVSRGISVFMGDKYSGMSITFIYWIQNVLSGVPLWAFVVAAIAVYVMIAVFLQSTSGVAGITMPIFGAIAMALFAASSAGGTGGQILLISAFTVGVNFVCSIYPEATNMGICELTHVPYDRFVKSMIKISLPMLLISAVIISVAPYIGLV